ncbi:hypothetical protein I6F37_39035 [Bradyrhizobium sp. NBAIM08]|nr:hypothetical protein [Bradyrhizobium sp. NBAIM08]
MEETNVLNIPEMPFCALLLRRRVPKIEQGAEDFQQQQHTVEHLPK